MARIKKLKMPEIATVIGADTVLEGNIFFSGGMHLDGTIQGNVTGLPDTGATLVVSRSGRIEGDVMVDNLVLDGTVIGDVRACNRVELAPDARVQGTVHYRLLEMAMGAEVNGQLVHVDEEEACGATQAEAESGGEKGSMEKPLDSGDNT